MAWTSLTFTTGEILTAAEMTQMYDNFTALAENDSNAPVITGRVLQRGFVSDLVGSDDTTEGGGELQVMSLGNVSRPESCSLLVHYQMRLTGADDAVTTFNHIGINIKHNTTNVECFMVNSWTGIDSNAQGEFSRTVYIPLNSADSGDLVLTLNYSYEASPGTAGTAWDRMQAMFSVIQN